MMKTSLNRFRNYWRRGFHSAIARRFVLFTVLCSTLLAVIITAIQLYIDYRSDLSIVYKNLETIEKSRVPSLMESVWKIDDQLIEAQLQGILQLEGVEHVAIINSGVDYAFGHKSRGGIYHSYSLKREEAGRAFALGELQVTLSLDHVYQKLIKRGLIVLFTNSIKTLLVATFIVMIYQMMIGQHLYAIAAFAREHIGSESDVPHLSLQRQYQGEDELHDLEKAINQWIDTHKIHLNAQRQANEKITRQRDKLEKLNGELEEFTYRTSHDLRSPLISSTKLLSITDQTLVEGDIEKSRHYIGVVQKSLDKLNGLVTDILQLTRLNYQELPQSQTDISNLVEETLQKNSNIEGFDEITISQNYHYADSFVTQKEHLSFIIENLLSNAIKYRDPKKEISTINVEVNKVEKDVILTVVDNGLGIPEKYRSKLFSMFNRFHPDTAFGSGLGLYMVKKSIDKIKGHIAYEDTGDGSKFIVSIPMHA